MRRIVCRMPGRALLFLATLMVSAGPLATAVGQAHPLIGMSLIQQRWPAASSVVINVFYPVSEKAYNAWVKAASSTPPPETDWFPTGSKHVAFYLDIKQATPNSTKYSIAVTTGAGKRVVTVAS